MHFVALKSGNKVLDTEFNITLSVVQKWWALWTTVTCIYISFRTTLYSVLYVCKHTVMNM